MRIGYLDLSAGASGDMLMAAVVDVGRHGGVAIEEAVAAAVGTLGLGCSVEFEDAERGGLRCLRAEVRGAEQRHTLEELREGLRRCTASSRAKARAARALDALVEAETKVHGTATADVDLHELGTADTAADLIGTAVGFEMLSLAMLVASPVPVPRGHAEGAHGSLPLPAPATLQLLRGVPMFGVDEEHELVTPTAAAILGAHRTTFAPMPPMTLEEVGVGGGTRDTHTRPNVCRLLVGEPVGGTDAPPAPVTAPRGMQVERTVLLEANIDDQTPEGLGHAIEAIMAAGALDAWVRPIVMKKSRPAFELSILVRTGEEARILDVTFRETTTIGVRRREVARWVLRREDVHVPVRGTNVRVKVARMRGEVVNVAPEYDDCLTVANRTGVAFKEVMAEASDKARRLLES